MKKIILLFTIIISISILLSSNTVFALEDKDTLFINNNGVKISQSDSKYISDIFYDGYKNFLTIDDYNLLMSYKDYYKQMQKIELFDLQNRNESFHETTSKKITVTSICSDDCLIINVIEWKKMPIVRSYDLIGSYFDNVSLLGDVTTQIYNGISLSNNIDTIYSNHGFGAIIKLPNNGNCMKISQYFRTSKNGSVYSSYQHAIKSITLNNSKKFSLGYNGAGHVFLFNTINISNYYDNMQGVHINI